MVSLLPTNNSHFRNVKKKKKKKGQWLGEVQ